MKRVEIDNIVQRQVCNRMHSVKFMRDVDLSIRVKATNGLWVTIDDQLASIKESISLALRTTPKP